jgi:hypothetical protein
MKLYNIARDAIVGLEPAAYLTPQLAIGAAVKLAGTTPKSFAASADVL